MRVRAREDCIERTFEAGSTVLAGARARVPSKAEDREQHTAEEPYRDVGSVDLSRIYSDEASSELSIGCEWHVYAELACGDNSILLIH